MATNLDRMVQKRNEISAKIRKERERRRRVCRRRSAEAIGLAVIDSLYGGDWKSVDLEELGRLIDAMAPAAHQLPKEERGDMEQALARSVAWREERRARLGETPTA